MSVTQESVEVSRGTRQTIDDLPAMARGGSPGSTLAFEIPPGLRLADLVKAAVLQTLDRVDGNRTRAAQCLGISVRTLQRKLKQWNAAYPLSGEEADGAEEADSGMVVLARFS
jgi:transcriptional regulator of acetoin/glycerol metabolism